MAKLQISGQVLYNNLTPAPNAHVEIWELDLGPGGVNDKILTRTTNDQGRFSGLSSEWEDREGVAVFGVSVPDILNLEFRVSVDGKTHKGPFVMGQGTSVPIVLPFGPSKPVSKSKRDLVQIIYLSDTYTGGERALYQFIEASSEGVVSAGLGQQYRHIHVLKGNDATLAKFKSALQTAGNVAGVAAVDVMFNTHGSSDKVHFKDGAKSTTTVKDSLNGLSAGVRAKFRAVFSTACFGATHLNMWTNVGFSVACGSAGIYADSAVSFAPLVDKWASEATFAETVQLANSVGDVADNVSKAYYNANGKPDKAARVDSTRSIGGNGQVRLYSLP
jgi:hypothetical protein